jgi:hypothetical protein
MRVRLFTSHQDPPSRGWKWNSKSESGRQGYRYLIIAPCAVSQVAIIDISICTAHTTMPQIINGVRWWPVKITRAKQNMQATHAVRNYMVNMKRKKSSGYNTLAPPNDEPEKFVGFFLVDLGQLFLFLFSFLSFWENSRIECPWYFIF